MRTLHIFLCLSLLEAHVPGVDSTRLLLHPQVHAGADVAPILDALPELVESLAPLQQAAAPSPARRLKQIRARPKNIANEAGTFCSGGREAALAKQSRLRVVSRSRRGPAPPSRRSARAQTETLLAWCDSASPKVEYCT